MQKYLLLLTIVLLQFWGCRKVENIPLEIFQKGNYYYDYEANGNKHKEYLKLNIGNFDNSPSILPNAFFEFRALYKIQDEDAQFAKIKMNSNKSYYYGNAGLHLSTLTSCSSPGVGLYSGGYTYNLLFPNPNYNPLDEIAITGCEGSVIGYNKIIARNYPVTVNGKTYNTYIIEFDNDLYSENLIHRFYIDDEYGILIIENEDKQTQQVVGKYTRSRVE